MIEGCAKRAGGSLMTRNHLFSGLFYRSAVAFAAASLLLTTASQGGCSGPGETGPTPDGGAVDMASMTMMTPKSGATSTAVRLGGMNNDAAFAVATDAAGNVYVTGQMIAPIDLGGGPLPTAGMSDFYVAKFDSSGTHLWSKGFGGTSNEGAFAIALDRGGNVWVGGSFYGSLTLGGNALTSAGNGDLFLLSLGGTDGAYRAAYRYGGGGDDFLSAMAIDSGGNILATGGFAGATDFGGGTLTSAGRTDGYILKVSASGAHLWSKRFGDTDDDTGGGVAVGPGDEVNLVATFIGSADVGGGKINAATAVAADILVARFGADGSHVFSKGTGARFDALRPSIAVDLAGNLLLTATYDGSFSMGGAIFSSDGLTDVGVAKWDKDGSHLWSYRFSGPDYDLSDGIAVDPQGNVIVVGHYKGNSRMSGGPYMKSNGNYDGWAVKMAPSGQFLWSQHYGGVGDDSVADAATDLQGNIWMAGQFTATAELGKGPMNVVDAIDGFLIKVVP